MASNEGQFKAELAQRAREQGGQVVLVTGSYLAGIPDMYVKMPDLPGVWIELKFDTSKKGGRYPNKLTPLQRIFIRNMRHVNGEAYWLECIRGEGGRTWGLYGSHDPDVDRVDERHYLMTRAFGQKWDMLKILASLGVLSEEIEHGR